MSLAEPLTTEFLSKVRGTLEHIAHEHPRKMLLLCCPGERDEVLELFRRNDPGVFSGALGHLDGIDFELRTHNFCKAGHVIIMRHPDEWEPIERMEIVLGGAAGGDQPSPI